jgi:precorrin-2 dehydrogenase/sirohydrochlorin ferrochelatase
MNTLFPAFLNLSDTPCTVIGGGAVALRKILALLEVQASVRVISLSSIAPVRQLFHDQKIDLLERAYEPGDLDGSFLVVAATNDREINADIAQHCHAQRILCNIVDDPDAGNFHFAPTYVCGDLKIAISTNGASPTLAGKIKTDLADQYPDEYLPYLQYLRRMRETVKEKVPEESVRKRILKKLIADPGVLEHCRDEQFCRQLENLDYSKEVERWL